MPHPSLIDPRRRIGGMPKDIEGRGEPPTTGARGAVPGAPGLPYEPPRPVSFPPWIFAPVGSTQFFFAGSQTVTGPNTTVTLTAPQFQIPLNQVGVVRDLGFFVNDLLATSDITFRLRFSQHPVQGYDQIFIFPRLAGSVSKSFLPESTVIRVPDNTTIDIEVTVVDAGSYPLGAEFKGWSYSKALAQEWGVI